MGPCVGIGDPVFGDCDDTDMRGLKAVILCDTPSARMNCSRNSMLVRPFAIFAFAFYDFPHKSQIKAARKINPQQKHTNKKSKTKLRVGNWWLMMDHEVIGKLK